MKSRLAALVLFVMATNALAVDLKASDYRAMIKLFKTKVARDLKDPASAQFRDVVVSRLYVSKTGEYDDKRFAICGEMNAKNSYGAYTGFTLVYGLATSPSDIVVMGGFLDDVGQQLLAKNRAKDCGAVVFKEK